MGTSRNLQEPSGISRNLQEPRGISRNLQEPPGTSRNLQEPPGASRNLQEPPGTSRNLHEPPGASRNLQELTGTFRSLPKPPGHFWVNKTKTDPLELRLSPFCQSLRLFFPQPWIPFLVHLLNFLFRGPDSKALRISQFRPYPPMLAKWPVVS